MHFALETNAFRAGDEHVENAPSNFNHTRTQLQSSYQRLPNRTYVEIRIRVDAGKRFNYMIRFSTAALILISVNVA